MSEHDDKMLDDFLKGGSPYSQRYQELPAEDVPPELDAAILAASRAVPVVKPLQRWRRWSVPVALAATLVLAVAIVIDTPLKQASVSLPRPAAAPAVEQYKPAVPAERETPTVTNADKSTSAALAEARRDAEPADVSSAKDVSARDELAKKQKTESAPVVVTTAQRRQEISQGLPIGILPAIRPASPAPVIAPPPPPVAVNQPPPAASPAQEMRTKADAAAQSASAEESSRAKQVQDARSAQEVVVTGALRRSSLQSGAGPHNSIAPAEKGEATLAREEREADPALWLDYIRKLRSDGDARGADREWTKFVKTYPNYTVAEDDAARPKR